MNTQEIQVLKPVQSLATSGARAVKAFVLDGHTYLAVPQLAQDIPGAPAYMNGGSSDLPTLMYRWSGGQFVQWQQLPSVGGEDAEFFHIGGRAFLAVASLREGAGPYELNVHSTVYEWTGERFEPFQQFATYAAKQWKHFQVGSRHFLALAQGIRMEGAVAKHPAASCIYEWDGKGFVHFQDVRSGWGYNWCPFVLQDEFFLGYADHVEPTCLLRWNGAQFVHFQDLESTGGRALCHFQDDGLELLAVANLLGESWVYRWHKGAFERKQHLSDPGAREVVWFQVDQTSYLALINFIRGPREQPQTALQSRLWRCRGGMLDAVVDFPTLGGTDAAAFRVDGVNYLAVSNSLSEDVRFRTDTIIYRLALTDSP